MELIVKDTGASIDVAERGFAREMNPSLVHQTVVGYLAGGRVGSKAQKSRSQVRGGGKKPWRQKGTGRARSGTSRSPLWRGGGVTFAARPRSYEVKLNKKMYRAAMAVIVSELCRQDRLLVVEKLEVESPKTKLLVALLTPYRERRLLLLIDQADANLELAARNIPWVHLAQAAYIDPVTLIGADRIVATVAAIKQLEGRLI